MIDEETYDFGEVRVIAESLKAYKVKFAGREWWVPKSQIRRWDRHGGSWRGLRTTLWWANQSGAAEAYEYEHDDGEQPPWNNPPPPPPSTEVSEFMKDINELWQAVKADTGGSFYFPTAGAVFRRLALKYHPDVRPT